MGQIDPSSKKKKKNKNYTVAFSGIKRGIKFICFYVGGNVRTWYKPLAKIIMDKVISMVLWLSLKSFFTDSRKMSKGPSTKLPLTICFYDNVIKL